MATVIACHEDTVLQPSDWDTSHSDQEIVERFRVTVRNNKRWLKKVNFLLVTDETWLPNALVQVGFFPSGNMVKKNQPQLWRDIQDDELVKLSWAHIRIVKVGFSLD